MLHVKAQINNAYHGTENRTMLPITDRHIELNNSIEPSREDSSFFIGIGRIKENPVCIPCSVIALIYALAAEVPFTRAVVTNEETT